AVISKCDTRPIKILLPETADNPLILPLTRVQKKRAPEGTLLSFLLRVSLLAQTARDVAEHVLDLVAEDDQHYDDHDSDQDEDKGVLDHTLPFLTVEQIANLVVDGGKH